MSLVSFREYVAARTGGARLEPCRSTSPLYEADAGLLAFVDSQNRSFKVFLQKLLDAKKFTDPRLVHEAESLVADHANQLFNYGQELLKIASAGRARLAGGDALQAATEAAGRLWELLWRPDSYAGSATWETRFPQSAERGGIRGTVRAAANNLIGQYAQRLRKSRPSVSTVQQSQIADPDQPFDVAATPSTDPDEWAAWRAAIMQELTKDLHDELARNRGGKHGEARIRNLRWALAIAAKQMELPYQWRSMPEVMAEIPELRSVGRGGLQQTLTDMINDARQRAVAKIGSDREQAVARSLQTRGRRKLVRTPEQGVVPPFVPQTGPTEQATAPPGYISFHDYIAAREGLMLTDRPLRAGMARINVFPATQKKLQRLLARRPVPANTGSAVVLPSPTSPRPTAKPIPSPLQAAQDAFAGHF